MYRIDAAYCCRRRTFRGRCACLSVCLARGGTPANTDEPIEMAFGTDSCGPKEPDVRLSHIGATWRIRSIDLCGGGAKRPVAANFFKL